ncbi:Arginyl-tRNA--protein transferase [hydrothermal vent metagenome]|uniref:Arginyl-tRNA--protein transferase n=1 Tax=hydrothermal vent metagenome TaxID=652676 RepID=A0A3B1BLU9_9ZZZZ
MNDPLKPHKRLSELPFYVTPSHPCSYLDDRQASTVFVDPTFPLTMEHYEQLAALGFRRSGDHVYRPNCTHCKLCIPVRIPVNSFQPNRNQRRCLRKNKDISIRTLEADFNEEHFKLYRHYMSSRHAGGGMDKDDPEAYQSLISAHWCNTQLLEFHLQENLVAIAVLDQFQQGMSAVYTFFDPSLDRRSLGVFAILTEIHRVQEAGFPYLYLGYWNPQTVKMAYKSNYAPMEYLEHTGWHSMEDNPLFKTGK